MAGTLNPKPTNNNKTKKSNNSKLMASKLVDYSHYSKIKDDDATFNPAQKDKCSCIRYEVHDSNTELHKCNNTIVPGTNFCKEHQNCLGYLQKYLSGYEPKYEPAKWSHPYVEGSHNCYAYFLDDRKRSITSKCEEYCLKNNKKGCPLKDDECQNLIPQPGDYHLLSQYGKSFVDKKERKYTCPNMNLKILSDNPSIKPVGFLDKCPANYYKGAMVVDTGNTFHFYRQNTDGTWSHKPGVLPVTNVDASGKKIYVPHFANRNYQDPEDNTSIKYDAFCGYYCIPTNKYIETNIA